MSLHNHTRLKDRAVQSIALYGYTAPGLAIAREFNVPVEDVWYMIEYFLRPGVNKVPAEIIHIYYGDRWADLRWACSGVAMQQSARHAGIPLDPYGD